MEAIRIMWSPSAAAVWGEVSDWGPGKRTPPLRARAISAAASRAEGGGRTWKEGSARPITTV